MTSSKGASTNDVRIPQANPSNDLKVLYILLSIHSWLGAGQGASIRLIQALEVDPMLILHLKKFCLQASKIFSNVK